jgi:membrane-bound serine protease (ClpP class)
LLLRATISAIAPDATVGPANPVTLGDDDGQAALDMVNTALIGLGVPRVAEGTAEFELVGSRLTASELTDVVDLEVPGLEALIQELDGRVVTTADGAVTLDLPADEVTVRFHSLGLVRRLLHAASTGPFIYLLLTVGLGMLLFELFQPGFGVAGVAGVITIGIGIFGLTVLPVTWWGVALVALGMVLFAVDTAIAGFGPVTLGAVVALSVGSANFYAAEPLDLPWWVVTGTVITAFVFFVFVMTSLLRAQAGPAEDAIAELIGRRGVVRSVLNPEGHVFVDGALWRARWADESRAAKVGTVVRVRDIDGPLVLVETDEDGADGPSDAVSGTSSASSS